MTEEIGRLLLARNWRVAVAESATGGLIGHWLTQVAGSSQYFWGGIIAYDNAVKMRLLGVREATLACWGAVSAPVALEMAAGACRALAVEIAVSVTGIAGPTGATASKPVGLYYLGLATPTERWAWRHLFTGDRLANNEAAAAAALRHLTDYLENGTCGD
ncbi:MAG TPA: CinA family protein [Anaerolineae bacterium]|nr:CinA family protein [Anaerolineae bacterium]HQH38012.1 CinA family protein [Anaerolineae bacterium]